MRRLSTVLLAMTWLLLGMPQICASRASGTPPPATLKSITVTDPSVGRELLLRIDGEYSFKTIRTPEGELYVDLQGAKTGGIPLSAKWSSGLVAGYQLLQYTGAGGVPVVRMEIRTRRSEPFVAERERTGLHLLFGRGGPAKEASASTAPVALSSPSKMTDGPALVSDIQIKPGPAGDATIDVATTKPATFRAFQLKNPARLVVDLQGLRNAVRRKSIPVSSAILKDVRVGQYREKSSEVVRVVADLAGDPLFDAHAYAGGVRIELKPRSMVTSQAMAPTRASEPEASARRTEIAPVREMPVTPAPQVASAPIHPLVGALPEPQTELIPDRTNATVPAPATIGETSAHAKANEVSKPDYNSALPAAEGGKEVAAAPRVTPQTVTPEALRADKAARILNAEAGMNLYAAQGAIPAGAAQTGAEKPSYTGEPISLNLKDVDLKDFFRLVHEISGLNIIVDPNVTGSVTTVLDNVPWDQALDMVLRDNGLGKVLDGNVLRIARMETLTAEQETANKLAAARIDAAPMATIFQPLNFANAQKISSLLKTWAGGGALTKRGSVLVDDRTNTLIISDVQSQIPVIQGILARLDTKTKQVAIEARIVLATSTFERTLSAALVGSVSNHSGSTSSAGQTGTGASVTPSTTTTPPTFTIPQNATTGFGAVAITNYSARYMIDAAISAAEIRTEAKTISRPSIITQNNVEGMVQQGVQIPVQTSINNTVTVTYMNATLQLHVTPQVTDDGHIFLKIDVNNASPGTLVTNAGISINTQQATTSVLVPDGGTVVFGGVTVTERTNSSTGIPLLGNIPILGHLFKSTTVQDNDQELLFFVSPKILQG